MKKIVFRIREKQTKFYYFYCVYGKPVFKHHRHGSFYIGNKETAEIVMKHTIMLAPQYKDKLEIVTEEINHG